MQSAVPHVLATLDRTHDPARVPDVVRWARDAGLAVSLDLIYGTPGESVEDWRRSVVAALDTGVEHVSAYALVVEDGTRMGGQVRRGELAAPDPDDQATKYEIADDLLSAAGLGWYEVSNWARPGGAVPAQPGATGAVPTGGGSGRGRTRTSAGRTPRCAGGTSSTRGPTPSGSRTGAALRPVGRCSTPRTWRWSACCSGSGSVRGSR